MNRTPVTSSSIAAVGYDPSTMTLEIEFKHGAVYQYFDVPEAVYRELMNADSKGIYFNSMIRGAFRHAKA
ncbi:MAG: KTSC domain-containing protein [Kiritimatiellia bacterium]|jgi:hypothetical protein